MTKNKEKAEKTVSVGIKESTYRKLYKYVALKRIAGDRSAKIARTASDIIEDFVKGTTY